MNTEILDSLKVNLIVEITHLDDEKSLRQIGNIIDEMKKRPTEKQLEMLKKLAKPIKKKLDLEELKREQNWKPSSSEEIHEIIKDFDWQISDEEFLQILKDD